MRLGRVIDTGAPGPERGQPGLNKQPETSHPSISEKGEAMRKVKQSRLAIAVAIIGLALLPSAGGKAQEQPKPKREFFQAVAMGQSTQMGQLFNVNIIVEEYSTPDDQQALLGAFNSKGMEGLSNALSKMKSKGRLAITGTLGYDVSYIRSFPTATGRKIRLVTNRAIRFGEAWADGRSMDYSLSAVELDISNEKGKNTGILLPACQFKLDKEKHLEIENYRNPWKLQNILDR
jgi:hypothetical protein